VTFNTLYDIMIFKYIFVVIKMNHWVGSAYHDPTQIPHRLKASRIRMRI